MAAPPLPRWLLEFAEFLAETQEKSQRQTCWRAVLRLALGFGYKLPSSTSAVAMHPASAPCFAAGVRMLEDEVDGARLLLLAERWLERNGLEASSATLKPLRTLAHFCAQRSAPAPKPPRLMAGLGSFATARESSHGLRLVPNVEHTSWAVELGASDDAAGDATAPPSLFVCSSGATSNDALVLCLALTLQPAADGSTTPHEALWRRLEHMQVGVLAAAPTTGGLPSPPRRSRAEPALGAWRAAGGGVHACTEVLRDHPWLDPTASSSSPPSDGADGAAAAAAAAAFPPLAGAAGVFVSAHPAATSFSLNRMLTLARLPILFPELRHAPVSRLADGSVRLTLALDPSNASVYVSVGDAPLRDAELLLTPPGMSAHPPHPLPREVRAVTLAPRGFEGWRLTLVLGEARLGDGVRLMDVVWPHRGMLPLPFPL